MLITMQVPILRNSRLGYVDAICYKTQLQPRLLVVMLYNRKENRGTSWKTGSRMAE